MLNTFDEYEELIAKTAVYPAAGSGTYQALSYTGLGLAGEAGEVAGKISKLARDKELDKAKVLKECGDVLWFLTATANELGYHLRDVAEVNYVNLTGRLERGTIHGNGDDR